ncbi:hypothetical protein [Pyrococcus kukulkanii]|uniref:hypothetical protein n=1 Tax=Pyrococcus kukulkanii TaxID=1609559 RepID=UPI003564B081
MLVRVHNNSGKDLRVKIVVTYKGTKTTLLENGKTYATRPEPEGVEGIDIILEGVGPNE